VIFDVGGVMRGGGVPGGGDGLAGELERDGAPGGEGGAVAGLACAEDLAGVLDRDLDAPLAAYRSMTCVRPAPGSVLTRATSYPVAEVPRISTT